MISEPRFLIVKTTSMGDVIHALPVVSDILRVYPQARIDWLVEESFAVLPHLHPGVRRVLPVAVRRWRKHWLARATRDDIEAARARVRAEAYDAIIDLQGLIKSAWLARWARGPLFGFDRSSAREPLAALLYAQRIAVPRGLHAIERNRRLAAQALGYAVEGASYFGLRAPASSEFKASAFEIDGHYAVLLTNASRATKLWPDAQWHAVEQQLAEKNLRSVLLWGSDAEGQATRARAAAMRNAVVAPRLSLDAAASVLSGARCVIGLDTGLTHLAAALERPCIGIFCDYDPALVGISGDAPCESLGSARGGPSTEDVLAALERMLSALAVTRT